MALKPVPPKLLLEGLDEAFDRLDPGYRLEAHLLENVEPGGGKQPDAEERFDRHAEEDDLHLWGKSVRDSEEHLSHEDREDRGGCELDRDSEDLGR